MSTRVRSFLVVFSLALAMSVLGAGSALAAKGSSKDPSSISLVVVTSPYNDGLPHWNGQVTFNASSTATTEPWVSLDCYQGGNLVYGATDGFFASYPTQLFQLASPSWTGGAADCTATLYYLNGSKATALASLSFHVYS